MILIKNLTFGYEEGRLLLRDVNLRIEAGETVAIRGENGSGKTTLLRLLAGLELPCGGSFQNTFGRVSLLPTTLTHFLLPWYDVAQNMRFFESRGRTVTRGDLQEFDTMLQSWMPAYSETLIKKKIY